MLENIYSVCFVLMYKFLLQCFLDVIIVCLGLVSGMALIMSVIIGLLWLWLGL